MYTLWRLRKHTMSAQAKWAQVNRNIDRQEGLPVLAERQRLITVLLTDI